MSFNTCIMGHNQITLDDNKNIYSVFADENGANAKILKIDSSGKASTFYTFTSTTIAKSITFLEGFIYFADNDGSGTNYIFRKNVIDNTTDTVFVKIATSNNVYFTSDKQEYIYYGCNNAIYKVHKTLNMPSRLVSDKLNAPKGMAVYNGVLYVADSYIQAINLTTNIVSTFASGLTAPLDIAIDRVEGAMYVADNQIKKIHNGIVSIIAGEEISGAKGLCLIENNTIYVSEDKHIRLIEYV